MECCVKDVGEHFLRSTPPKRRRRDSTAADGARGRPAVVCDRHPRRGTVVPVVGGQTHLFLVRISRSNPLPLPSGLLARPRRSSLPSLTKICVMTPALVQSA